MDTILGERFHQFEQAGHEFVNAVNRRQQGYAMWDRGIIGQIANGSDVNSARIDFLKTEEGWALYERSLTWDLDETKARFAFNRACYALDMQLLAEKNKPISFG